MEVVLALTLATGIHAAGLPGKKKKQQEQQNVSPLDEYVRAAMARSRDTSEAAAGSLWTPSARLTDFARDARASQVDDIVTILVSETVNAVASGASSSDRASSANSSISSLLGPKSPTGALANLAKLSGDQKLQGTGSTSRAATLNATISARVVAVLPGGQLVIAGDKGIQVNSEQQTISLRGVIRTTDISTLNTIPSTQIADMEIRVNGKGLVADAVRRPNILYRILLGILPF